MSRFTKSPTKRIDVGEGDWVEYKTQLTFGERNLIRKTITAGARKPDGQIDLEQLNHLGANRELLLRSITAWGGSGFCEQEAHPHAGDCVPRPVNAENLDALDLAGEVILQAIVDGQVTHTPGLKDSPSLSTQPASPSPKDSSTSETARSSSDETRSSPGSTSSSSAPNSDGAGTIS
jgi:hypothetical protein